LTPTQGRARRRAPGNARNEIDSILAGSDPAGSGKHQPVGGTAAAIKALFSAAKALLWPKDEDEPKPEARRRRGETDKGFAAACRTMLRRAARTGAVARGRYAGLRPVRKAQEAKAPDSIAPGDAYARARMYLADTLDWLNLWQDNAENNDHWYGDEFSAKQDQEFPQP